MMPSTATQHQRIGVLGGTFDPIHIGHLIIAEEARYHLALDRVIFVPARVSPLKQDEGTHFGNEQRYEMVCRAIDDNAAFDASRVDLDRESPSYTVDTLKLLREAYGPEHDYFFIMGADSLDHLPQWYRPQELLNLARLIVVSRPGHHLGLETVARQIPGIIQATDVIQGLDIGISSTDIRQRIRQGLPIRYQVPQAVLECITSYKRHTII